MIQFVYPQSDMWPMLKGGSVRSPSLVTTVNLCGQEMSGFPPTPTPKNQPITELDESRPDEVIDGPAQEEKITTVFVMESPESMTTQPAKKGYQSK